MNMTRLTALIFTAIALFAGCSKPQPSIQVLEREIQNKTPKHFTTAISSTQFSPMTEILGTTLPKGSWQIDVKVTISPKETLYVAYTPNDLVRYPVYVEAAIKDDVRTGMNAIKPLLQWDLSRKLTPKAHEQKLKPLFFIVPVASPATQIESWIKLIAEPRGKEWKISFLDDADGIELLQNAKSRREFGSEYLAWGSSEQVEAIRILQMEKSDEEAQLAAKKIQEENERQAAELHRRKIESIRPKVDAVRLKQTSLEQKYAGEVQARIDALDQEWRDKFEACERKKDQLFRTMSNSYDQYAERDKLIAKESREWQAFAVAFESQKAELQKGFRSAALRAKTETAEAVAAICKDADLSPSEYGF